MECRRCQGNDVVKNGRSRHGRQRWLCRNCARTGGEKDHRRVAPEKRASALAHYGEGVGLRATERLVGVSHHAGTHWVFEEVEGRALPLAKPGEVELVEADELWTCVGPKKNGLRAVEGNCSCCQGERWLDAGRSWNRKPPAVWRRSFLTPPTPLSAPTSGIRTASSFPATVIAKAKPIPSPAKATTTVCGSVSPASAGKPIASFAAPSPDRGVSYFPATSVPAAGAVPLPPFAPWLLVREAARSTIVRALS